jgi:thiol-disulfide isomerase/thioredoxin
MRTRWFVPTLLVATTLTSATIAVQPRPALAAPKQAPCAVCSVKEGAGPEPVRATATYNGKEYTFCNDGCKKEFLANPAAFLKSPEARPAPALALKDLNGKTVSLEEYRGKVVLLDFWATWCSPCVAAMPKLQKLHDKYAAKGFAVVGVAIDEGGSSVVQPVVARKKVVYPTLLGTEAAWKAYEVKTLPALFLVDREGRIVKQFGGATSQSTIENEVRLLVGGAR